MTASPSPTDTAIPAPAADGGDEPPPRAVAVAGADSLSILTEHADPPPGLAEYLRHHLVRLIEAADVDVAELTVAVVDDARMSELHARHLGISGPTDVLTFDLSDGGGTARQIIGDVAVNLDEARRQAAGRGHGVELELLLYALHGLLHLSGYDDLDEASARVMHTQEDRLLVAVGLPAAYASGEAT